MEQLPVPCHLDSPECEPLYATKSAAGADLRAHIQDSFTLGPGERRLIPTGVRLEIPDGYEGQVRPRSGLALNSGVTVLNAPGTIDPDYRGEVKVLLINLGSEPYVISPNDRIAQLVVAPFVRAKMDPGPALVDSGRGEKGFGSTGR